jgi:predicted phage terminase large subunit-like protein
MTNEECALMQEDFMSFAVRCFSELHPGQPFQYGLYLELVAAKLASTLLGDGPTRLIINLPPRTLKSIVISVAGVAWLLGRSPTSRVICASYGQDLSDKFGRDTRTIMLSRFYRELFPWTVLSPTRRAVNDFYTTKEGYRMATSVGGTLTGRGADVVIIDDPIKPQEAQSEAHRKAASDWFSNTLLSRLNNKKNGSIILVMQRLHAQDLVGEVLDREHWDVLSLPAIAIEDECHAINTSFGTMTYSRKTGEALHPERDSVETYLQIRAEIGEYEFQSQYQAPCSREGGLIKREWLKYYDPDAMPTDFWWILQSWDTAQKCGDTNDYSVCTTWTISGNDFYLLDVVRRKMTFPELKRAVIDRFKQFDVSKLLIEDKSSGTSLIQELQEAGVYCIEEYKPDFGTDKYMRLQAQSTKFEAGRVLLPSRAPWLEEYIREIIGFPGAKHDDQVDSTTQALDALGKMTPFMGGCSPYFRPRGYETC